MLFWHSPYTLLKLLGDLFFFFLTVDFFFLLFFVVGAIFYPTMGRHHVFSCSPEGAILTFSLLSLPHSTAPVFPRGEL